jgi:acetyl-CoA carboxylase biotin carboxyl carrier protein
VTIRTIEAPMPGVIYLKATPDSAPYKQPGDLVAAGETIGLIEVMKSFMPVEADISGRLLRFLVANEDAVEPGQPICEIEG